MENNQEYPDLVECPLVDHEIDAGDCIENRDVINGNINVPLPTEYTIKRGYKGICRACKWYNVY